MEFIYCIHSIYSYCLNYNRRSLHCLITLALQFHLYICIPSMCIVVLPFLLLVATVLAWLQTKQYGFLFVFDFFILSILFCGFQVRQWITDRVTTNSPVSPSTSSSYPSSSSNDWSTPRRERASPLRGPHGKFVSPSSLGGYSSSSSPPDQAYLQRSRGERHTDMAELAKHVRERIY